MNVDWTTLKGIVDDRGLSIQWVDINDNYWLKVIDGAFTVSHVMEKTSPASSDQTDFETNYKSAGNKPAIQSVIPRLAQGDYQIYGDAVYITAAANTTTTTYFAVPAIMEAVKGGQVFADGNQLADYLSVKIEDKDGIVYPAGTVLRTIVNKWYMYPNTLLEFEDVDLLFLPYAGLYFRFEYTNTHASNSVNYSVNIKGYKTS